MFITENMILASVMAALSYLLLLIMMYACHNHSEIKFKKLLFKTFKIVFPFVALAAGWLINHEWKTEEFRIENIVNVENGCVFHTLNPETKEGRAYFLNSGSIKLKQELRTFYDAPDVSHQYAKWTQHTFGKTNVEVHLVMPK